MALQPHGGRLVSRFSGSSLDGMAVIEVSNDLRSDIENIPDGVFSPLEGFVGKEDFENIVKTTIFLTDMNDFAKVNEVYASYFTSAPPARSCVAVAALPKGVNVEIEVLARR